MNTHSNPYLPDFGEPASSGNSPLYSATPSPSLSLESTPSSTVLELPKEIPRNPHELPVFDEETLANPSETILYLPPFLSSLPPSYAKYVPNSTGRAPKATESTLPDIDSSSLSLHKALHDFTPVTDKYASMSYADAFNWDQLDLPEEDEHEWYCVAFKSIRKPGSENSLLYDADRAAHEEAVRNGGLIMYWYGIPDVETGLNLATCVWQSRAHAINANSGPDHIRAMRLAVSSYQKYSLERWTLRKTRGSRRLEVVPYDQDTAGR